MDLGLAGQRVLVTAASQGLGRAIATQLVQEGCQVVISSRRQETLDIVAAEICHEVGARQGQVRGIAADVMVAQDIATLVERTTEFLGGIDILITNAGGPPGGRFEELTDEHWLNAVNLNLMSVIRLVRAALPSLRHARHGGRILNVSSLSVKQPIPNLMLSNTVRAGTMAMLKSLAIELAPEQIQVHNLAPGRIDTDRVKWLDAARAAREGRTLDEVQAEEAAAIPMGRYGTPTEFAKLATFLVSPANSYMTGQTILTDGGVVRGL